MKPTLCLLLLLGLFPFQAKSNSVDSLLQEVAHYSPIEQVSWLIERGDSLRFDDPFLALKSADWAYAEAMKLGETGLVIRAQFLQAKLYLKLKKLAEARESLSDCQERLALATPPLPRSEAYLLSGRIWLAESEYDSARQAFSSAISDAQAKQETQVLAAAFREMGVLEDYVGNHEAAVEQLLAGLALFEELQNFQGQGICHNSLGKVNENVKKYPEAMAAYERAFACFDSLNNQSWMAIVLNNLGSVYLGINQMETGKEYLQQALALNQQTGDLLNRASILTNFAYIGWRNGAPEQALTYDLQVLGIYQRLENDYKVMEALNNVAYCFRDMQQLDSARVYALRSLALAREKKARPQARSALINLSTISARFGAHEAAYRYARQFIELNDSLSTESNQQQLAELQVKYESEKKEQSIALLQQEKALQSSKLRQRNLLIGLLLLGLAILVVGYVQRQRWMAKEQELAAERLANLEQERKLDTLSAMIKGQETERSRIARDLHDGLGGLLSSIRFRLAHTNQEANSPDDQTKADELIQEASEEVRRIAHHMVPGVLMRFGLIAAIESLCESISQSGKLDLHFHQLGQPLKDRLSQDQESMIYRIIQELIQNILKHAEATEAIVQIRYQDAELEITVEDNGKGFAQDAARSGLGLQSIEARVNYLNGSFLMESQPGEGTSVSILIGE